MRRSIIVFVLTFLFLSVSFAHVTPSGSHSIDSSTLSSYTWQEIYNGYGLVNANNNYVYLRPRAVTGPLSNTSAALVVLTDTLPRDYVFSADVTLIKQLRIGNPPNPWETAWLLYNYQDPDNFWYFTPKTNGIELARVVNDEQQFFVTENSPQIQEGQKYKLTSIVRNGIVSEFINDQEVATYNMGSSYSASNSLALYTEDAEVSFENILITPFTQHGVRIG
ncbi:hypothetical protein HZC07_03335 [Candidatus Micrarchaeota archaeon]|nr:hypothetical protein [Candidatus Micrarchaeota archaeon]